MLHKEDIICISSIDWDFIWQGHQEIMSTYARNGNRVLFIENTGIRAPTFKDLPRIRKRVVNWFKSVRGFRKEAENLYIYSPIVLPFPYSRIAGWFNNFFLLHTLRRWMDIMDFSMPVIWTFLPTQTALDIAHSVSRKALIYYYIADFDQLTKNYKKLKKTEEKLLKECDVVFVQGEYFKKRALEFNKNVFVFPFGVNVDIFETFKKEDKGDVPADLRNVKRPIIGYVGGIHRHVDFDLIKNIAAADPGWSVVMVGPAQTSVSQLDGLKNVHLVGKKEFSALPAYVNQFDVCMVPYLISEYTETVYPTKVNEYHIMGKPVVSTYLPEVVKANEDNLVLVAKNHDEFIKNIRFALENNAGQLKDARIRSALKHGWLFRIDKMSDRIIEAIAAKERNAAGWQEKFITAYKRSRGRLLRFALTIILLWAVIFYTPLVWYLAQPLKISQQPVPSDAIVVFAGGVGESGMAGQGYEERVSYAVELYGKGYAKNIIFSSGLRSTFPEPYVMKALATSLGVPAEAVTLEDKAASTYENVKFTGDILDKKGWNKIILISSPYHMRRASLVFSKVEPDKKVVYCPVQHSQFYAHGRTDQNGRRTWRAVKLEQIRAIIHEYLSILYYRFFKGWI